MSSKKRLYEVFFKVNRVSINENYDETEALDNFTDSVTDDIVDDFNRNPKMFQDGIPLQLNINTMDYGNIRFELDQNNSMKFDRAIGDKLQYVLIYNGNVNEYPILIKVPIIVGVEQSYDGKIVLDTKIYHQPKEIDVEFKQ